MRHSTLVPVNTIRLLSSIVLDYLRTLRPLEMRPQGLPAFGIVVLLHLATCLEAKVRDANHVATLEHERHAALAHFRRLELGVRCLFVCYCVGTVRGHYVVQTCACGLEATACFGIVLAGD